MSVATRETLDGYLCEEVDGILYPYAERRPTVYGHWHFMAVSDAFNMLGRLLRGNPLAGVFADTFVFWERGNNRKRVAPDAVVFPEVQEPGRARRSLRLWEERSQPVLVFEALSDDPEREDLVDKVALYRDELRIPEYFLCDPWVQPALVWGHRLEDGRYVEIEPDARGHIWSDEVRAWFGVGTEGRLQIWDAAGSPMPKHGDTEQALLERDRAERRAQSAEARIRELEEELRRRAGE